jgi:hypothetical protein
MGIGDTSSLLLFFCFLAVEAGGSPVVTVEVVVVVVVAVAVLDC